MADFEPNGTLSRLKFALDGAILDIDVTVEASSPSIDEGMRTVAARIAYYGRLAAKARAEGAKEDAKYRAWKGRRRTEIIDNAAGGKAPAQDTITAMIEADPRFKQHKDRIADAEECAATLEALVAALKEEAQLLRSRGANYRAEAGATDMTTRTDHGSRRRNRDDANAAMESAMSAAQTPEDDDVPPSTPKRRKT